MNKSFYLLLLILPFCVLFNAGEAYAAEIYFAPHTEQIYIGDVFVLEARISSPNELINVADGAFLFDKDVLEVTELSVGGSVFSLWAQEPLFSNVTGRVSFVGGVPDGFQDTDGLIVKTVFRAKQEGSTTLSFESGFSLLLNDGKGTRIHPQTHQRSLSIAKRTTQAPPKNEWKDLIETDTTPPRFVETIISKDAILSDNKYFVSFFATDEKSGIAYYEIREGDRAFVRAVSPYVFQNQTKKENIQIKSVDSAGNESMVTLEFVPTPSTPPTLFSEMIIFWIVVIVLLVTAIFLWLRKKYQN